ncbi:MAG: MBL fold metallo-hydrolase [Candidatus Micrarchaeia archaeon]
MTYLRCLGASHEVGRSAFLLSTDVNLLLDYGIKIFDQSRKPKYPITFPEEIDAAIITHAHLDHSGFVPYLYSFTNVKWYATPPTRDICEVMFKDSMKIMGEELPYNESHYIKALRNWHPVFYRKEVRFRDTRINFFDAGHIAGSAMLEIRHDKRKIVYTGDFNTENTRMHKGAEPIEDVDTLIIEGTYGLREHPNRAELEKKLISNIEETLDEGGHVLLPAFALGRSQELIAILGNHKFDAPIFLDGMSKAITDIYQKYPYYFDEFEQFRQALESITMVTSPALKKEVLKKPSIIITTAGMMEGGPVLNYLFNLNPNSKIIFTGYNVEGTNGHRLLNEGKIIKDGYELSVNLPAEYLDFSAHVGRTGLLDFIKKANPSKIILVHSDSQNADQFTTQLRDDFGYDAIAPQPDDKIDL